MRSPLFDWVIAEKIAKNEFNAAAILNGLNLYNEKDDEKAKVKIRLYRDWRNAGEKSKVAFEKAIKGEAVPALMFSEVLHFFNWNCPACGMTLPSTEKMCPVCGGRGLGFEE